jgi:hypothetical protein
MSSTPTTAETVESNADGNQLAASDVLPADANLSIPDSADHGEAAAIAAAIGAHLRDCAAAASDDGPEYCDHWTLCGRLGGRAPHRNVARGEEWKAAGRVHR